MAQDETEAIREAAAGWVARIHGDPSAAERRELDLWLAADPRHGESYRRIAQIHRAAAVLRESKLYRASGPRRRMGWVATGLAAAAAALALAWLPLGGGIEPVSVSPSPSPTVAVSRPQAIRPPTRITARRGEIRTMRLTDGSTVTLDTASAVDVEFGPDIRRLTLLRGRARFAVAHEARPFTVMAGGGAVTARGTVFDVALEGGGRVRVLLLRGAVDVVAPGSARTSAAGREPLRLATGQQAIFESSDVVAAVQTASPGEAAWPDGTADYADVSLAQLLERANRYAERPIVLADPMLGDLRVSGRFRINDPERLAGNLARLLALRVEDRPQAILLEREPQNNF